MLKIVASIANSNIGSNRGKASTGNKAPFDDDFAISAEIMVDEAEIPKLPTRTHIQNKSMCAISKLELNIISRKTPSEFVTNPNMILYTIFPKKILVESEFIFRNSQVSRSSSLTNIRDCPIIEVKKISTQVIPAKSSSDKCLADIA